MPEPLAEDTMSEGGAAGAAGALDGGAATIEGVGR